VVIDTNVLVSWFGSPQGSPARVAGLATSGMVMPCFDARIMAEYQAVLSRPRFRIDAQAVSKTLDALRAHGMTVIANLSTMKLKDESDRPFIEVAQTTRAWLVTGNLKHFAGVDCAVSPADFLRIMPGLG